MDRPANTAATGGRLTGDDLHRYTQTFTEKFLQGKIQYETYVLSVLREAEGGWIISVRDLKTGIEQTLRFDKVVLCTGGSNKPYVPSSLTPPEHVKTKATVIHSASFGAKYNDILEQTKDGQPVVVIGGGKSAQEYYFSSFVVSSLINVNSICAFLASQGRNVTIVYEKTDTFTASAKPLPSWVRLGRMLSVLSPYPNHRSRLERFLHTTWLGSKIVHGIWNTIIGDSYRAMHIPPAPHPLRLTYSHFWSNHFNDEGVPRPDGFHSLVLASKIKVVAPARMAGYAREDRETKTAGVLLSNGDRLHAKVLVLATGYTSSWGGIFDGLHPHHVATTKDDEWASYATLSNPPAAHPEAQTWATSIYKGIVPASNILKRDLAINGAVMSVNDGYTFETVAHWISSYFLNDKLTLPPTPEAALAHAERDARWFKKRWPGWNVTQNQAQNAYVAFFNWPQFCDELLEDMGLPSMRSGRNWLTWAVGVVKVSELERLHAERAEMRRKNA
ncbi:FAD/NAD-P-binding domain-containing protein [Mycena amicta]|nr:FAD/NAD-P-binding domain-containing protein [Mycena amicta]